VASTFGAFKERTEAILAEPDKLDLILAEGAERARAVAAPTLAAAYDRIGFLPVSPRSL
jgi:tryptophanyl-tRNA synthetase